MKVLKNELAQKISKIKSVVPKKTNTPVLQGVLVKDGYLIANNIEMTVKTKIAGADGDYFIIPMKAFDLINNLPEGEVEITVNKNNLIIKTDKIKHKCQTMDPLQFPETKMPEGDKQEIIIKSSELLESMKRVSYSIPVQSVNQTMTCMYLQATEGYLNFVGLDGHVLAWDKIKYSGEFELLIPKNTIDKLQTIGITGDVSIRHNKTGALFVTKDFEIYTRLVDKTYYKYQKMFKELPFHTVISRTELLDAIVRAKMCIEERKPVKFEISGEKLNISIKDNIADYYETVIMQKPMENDLKIGFNANLVIETLKAFDCGNINVYFQAEKAPMIIESENSDFKAIVLPVVI